MSLKKQELGEIQSVSELVDMLDYENISEESLVLNSDPHNSSYIDICKLVEECINVAFHNKKKYDYDGIEKAPVWLEHELNKVNDVKLRQEINENLFCLKSLDINIPQTKHQEILDILKTKLS